MGTFTLTSLDDMHAASASQVHISYHCKLMTCSLWLPSLLCGHYFSYSPLNQYYYLLLYDYDNPY